VAVEVEVLKLIDPSCNHNVTGCKVAHIN